MEELRKLEELQRTLSFMESRGFINSSSSNNDRDSNRFLADLLLLLVKPCGELDMDAKCSLILEHVPKFSASFPEGTSLWLSQEGSKQNCAAINLLKEPDYASLQNDNDDMAMIGLDAMQRANSTLEDFCRSYFMFHGMDVKNPREVFQYLPLLQFIESYIYQLDTMNEKILDIPANRVLEEGFEKETDRSLVSKLVRVLKSDPFGPLVALLETHGLLTERIGEEFKCGEEYWALERKLCYALMSKEEISIDLVMKAIYLKSFDYRVLNLLLYQLRREKLL